MKKLVMELSGPMMSFGTSSPMDERRHTALTPTLSTVAGIIAAAQGRPKEAPRDDLMALSMKVEVIKKGRLGEDFLTATSVVSSDGTLHDRVISPRLHLEDAHFRVELSGDDSVIQAAAQALREPTWAPGIGRRSFFPDRPLLLYFEGGED